MEDNNKKFSIEIDLSNVIFTIGIFIMIFLFVGKPDLWDVILYRLSDGQVELPMGEDEQKNKKSS